MAFNDTFDLGDIFWAKVGSHPWWPCMIYHTPDGTPFEKQTQRGCSYHVQFLGPLLERAWVHTNNLIPFEGKAKFDEYVSQKLKNTTDKSERVKFDEKSTACGRQIWTDSWKEAECAQLLTREKRLKKFGRIAVSKKVHKISRIEEGEMLKLIDNVPLTCEEESEALASFIQQEADARSENNPDIDRNLLEIELRTQWPSFDIPTKRSYLKNKLGIFDLQSDRLRRRSKVEAEQQSDKVSEDTPGSTKKSNKKKAPDSSSKTCQDSLEFDVEIHRLIVSPAQYRLQPVCPACEIYSVAPGQMFKCQGPCGRLMHPSCMRYKSPPPAENSRPEKFRCPECLTGNFSCAICRKPAEKSPDGVLGNLFNCQIPNCGRYFHKTCVIDRPGVLIKSNDTGTKSGAASGFQLLRCPSHCCQTCCLESGTSKPLNSCETPLLHCVRCPAAFHIGDLCTPAGSVEVSLSHIVCPRHFESELNNLPVFKTQHPSWCFKCFHSIVEKVCCETCPAVYHKECLSGSVEEPFRCDSCRDGMFPRYAQVIWAKIPHFRWWPCEIIHARNAPINILNMPHPEGTFPVHFLGSDEYQWVCRGSVLPYELGLKSPAAKDSRGSKSVEKAFTRALQRAPKTHQLYVNHVLKRGLPLTSMQAEPLPEEELLPSASLDVDVVIQSRSDEEHTAIAMSGVERIESIDYPDDLWPQVRELIKSRLPDDPCHCKTGSRSTSKQCCTKSNCFNLKNHVECTGDICSFESADCGNRNVSKMISLGEENRVIVFRTVNRGFGLKSKMTFEKDSMVTTYTGELISLQEANKRITDALGPIALANIASQRKGFKPNAETYMIRLSLDLDFVIDACSKGNYSRFINHSCEPNLRVENWIYKGTPHIVLLANRPIGVDEELTLDYCAVQILATGLMGATCLCLCGSDSCVSTLKMPSSYQSVYLDTEDVVSSAIPTTVERRKSKQRASTLTSGSTSSTKSSPLKKETKEEPSFTVVSLLAAAASHKAERANRSLIQPKVVAARSTTAEKSSPKSENKNTKYIPHGLQPVQHEDFCYRCGDGGELLLCDKTTCSKAFHLQCLGLSSPPAGIWYCPWHYCDVCGHPSTHLCWRCPNSYCKEHAKDSLIKVDALDEDRWNAVKTQANAVTSLAIISSFRWICCDHVGMTIRGPEHRPQVATNSQNSENCQPDLSGDEFVKPNESSKSTPHRTAKSVKESNKASNKSPLKNITFGVAQKRSAKDSPSSMTKKRPRLCKESKTPS